MATSLLVETTALPGVVLITPRVFPDRRGSFCELHRANRYTDEAGLPPFVQDNLSYSRRGTVRGLHYQLRHPQGKLVFAAAGAILDVVVDVRRGSPTFGHALTFDLSADNRRQVYVPPGFAHGLCALSEWATVIYKCTDYFAPGDEYTVRWNDPALALPWPVTDAILSDKDAAAPTLAEMPTGHLPVYTS